MVLHHIILRWCNTFFNRSRRRYRSNRGGNLHGSRPNVLCCWQICCQIKRSYRTSPGRCGQRNRKKGLSGALAQGFARASAAPQDSVSLMLGGLVGPNGPRAVGNLDVNLGRDVLAFASGEFASSNDWQAMAGLKMRF